MPSFVYTLSFDPLMKSPTLDQLHAYVEKHRDIQSWFVPFVGTYVLKSNVALTLLAPNFRQFFGDQAFVLTGTAHNLIGGSLPQAVWDWVNERPYAGLFDKAGS